MRLFVDQLTNVDFSYLCPERGIVGETWLANIELVGDLDQQGMVCDFGIVKKEIRQWLDNTLDHKLAAPSRHSCYRSQVTNDNLTIEFNCQAGTIFSTCPTEAVVEIDVEKIDKHAVARWCEIELKALFNDTVKEVNVNFTTELIDGPYYHYTHGLKKHDGNCQRIAHGHRSRILIWKNQQPCIKSMTEWAKKWQDIYIGSQTDLCESHDQSTQHSHLSFGYKASQGQFYLSLPKTLCYLMNTDTTVELIAEHIAQSLKSQSAQDTFKVKAFEGAGKGAITQC